MNVASVGNAHLCLARVPFIVGTHALLTQRQRRQWCQQYSTFCLALGAESEGLQNWKRRVLRGNSEWHEVIESIGFYFGPGLLALEVARPKNPGSLFGTLRQ